MKRQTNFITIFVMVTATCAWSQSKIDYYPDSIRVEFPSRHALIVLELRSIKEHPETIQTFPHMWKELIEYAKESSPALSTSAPQRIQVNLLPEGEKQIISYTGGHDFKSFGEKTIITIQPADPQKTTVTVKDNKILEMLPPGWEVYISSKSFQIRLYAETYEALVGLSTVNLEEVAQAIQSDDALKSIGRKAIRARFIMDGNSVQQKSVDYISPGAGDNIFLTGNAGIGIVQGFIYPEINLKIGLTFKDHFGRSNIRTSLIYNNLFFTSKSSEGYTANVNSFISLSFERNFNPSFDGPHWSGIGAGLLVNHSGDYFNGKTAKLFITHEIGRRVNLVPEFYLTNDFKKFTFGMTLKYNF